MTYFFSNIASFGHRWWRLGAAAAVLAVIVLQARAATAQQDPRWRWQTIETDHFRIHYYRGLDTVARRVAVISEETHRTLSRELDWEPHQITHLIVVDDTDYSQGITYISALNHIRIWVVAPEDDSTLEDFDDWLRLLVTHEYTHLIHIDQVRGLPAIINAIFGEIFHPMQMTPQWLTEGYAVHMESRHTSGGRVRSSRYDMYLRMAVLENEFLRLDQVSNSTLSFPQATVPYLYGQDFINYVARRFGNDVLRELAREMSNDLIPYGLNRAFRRVTGHTMVDLWRDWQRSLVEGYTVVADAIREQGLTDSRRLTELGENTGPPRFGARGERVFFYHASEESPGAIWSVDARSGELDRIGYSLGYSVVSPTSDGRYLYFTRGDRHRVIYQYRDIFRLDLRTGEEERMTNGARTHSVDVSPDGRHVTYAAFRSDSSDLWVANSELGQRRRLIEAPPGEQIYGPRFSPDGRSIAFSQVGTGGMRDIRLLDVESGEIRQITDDRALDMSPCFSPDGRWLVFTSDRTGIANIYAYDLEEERLFQVTNVISGAYTPDVSNDGSLLSFSGYSNDGYDVHVMPFEPERFRQPQPAREHESMAEPAEENSAAEPRMRERPYRPWATLAPRSWMIGLGEDAFGQALQLTTYGADASAAHRFAGTLAVGLERGDVGYDFTYEYGRLHSSITLRHAHWVAPRSTMRLDVEGVDFLEESYYVTTDISLFLGRGTSSHRLSAGYNFLYQRATTDILNQEWDPMGRPPRLPSLGILSGLQIGWSFTNARSSVRSISLEQGRSLSTSLTLYHPAFGSDYSQITFRYSWTEYILMPWRRHHVLALSLSGGISAGSWYSTPFYIGGYPEQDIFTALLDEAFLGGNYLRGYPSNVIGGDQYHMLNIEYRFPLWNPERGVYALPLFLSHFWFAFFCDIGGAFQEDLDFDELLVGVGGEVIFRFVVGYYVAFNLRVGYARGLMDGGDNQVFGVFGVPF